MYLTTLFCKAGYRSVSVQCLNSTQVSTILILEAVTGILTEQKFILDCRYRVIESSSLVSVLFIEVFSHPHIFFGFCVIIISTREHE